MNGNAAPPAMAGGSLDLFLGHHCRGGMDGVGSDVCLPDHPDTHAITAARVFVCGIDAAQPVRGQCHQPHAVVISQAYAAEAQMSQRSFIHCHACPLQVWLADDQWGLCVLRFRDMRPSYSRSLSTLRTTPETRWGVVKYLHRAGLVPDAGRPFRTASTRAHGHPAPKASSTSHRALRSTLMAQLRHSRHDPCPGS